MECGGRERGGDRDTGYSGWWRGKGDMLWNFWDFVLGLVRKDDPLK